MLTGLSSGCLRTTCLWTCDSSGTSMTISLRTRAWQPSRRPGFSPRMRSYRSSTSFRPDRASGAALMPCLGNSPKDGATWHFEQMPRPPQTLSRSTPNFRAASRIVVPCGTRPRLPDGVKITIGWPAPFPPTAPSFEAGIYPAPEPIRRKPRPAGDREAGAGAGFTIRDWRGG